MPKAEDVVKGVGVLRKILGKLTDLADVLPLPSWLKGVLKGGRGAGLWTEGHGPTGLNLGDPRDRK